MHCHSSDARPRRRLHRCGPVALTLAAASLLLGACSSSGLEAAATSTTYRSLASGADASGADASGASGASGGSGASGVSGASGDIPPWDDATNTTTPGMYGPDASVPLTTGTLPIDPPAASISAFFQAIGYGKDLSDCYQKAYLAAGAAAGPVDSRSMAELAKGANAAEQQQLLKCDRTNPKQFPTTTPKPAATAPTTAATTAATTAPTSMTTGATTTTGSTTTTAMVTTTAK